MLSQSISKYNLHADSIMNQAPNSQRVYELIIQISWKYMLLLHEK